MAHTQVDVMTKKDFLADQIGNLVTSSPLSYLLPSGLSLLAMGFVTRRSHRPTPEVVVQEVDLSKATVRVTHQINHRAHKVLRDFSRLEAKLSEELVRSGKLCRLLEKKRNFAHHRHRLEVDNARVRRATATQISSPMRPKYASAGLGRADGFSKPFERFCQRLLLQNKIWQQEKEIRVLKGMVNSLDATKGSSAFKAFCDRLLISNQVWRLQGKVKRLTEESEQLKRSRVAAVTRAAKQMVQDVRKDGLTEEFVKDLLAELDEHKHTIGSLRAEHEAEMAEMAEEWKKDYQRMAKEIELLQLGQEARLVEQEISNQMESDLLVRLIPQERNTSTMLTEEYLDDDLETLSGGSDLDGASTLSMSTAVGSPHSSPNSKWSFSEDELKPKAIHKHLTPLLLSQRSVTSGAIDPTTPKSRTPARRLNPEPYVGFSFNPLFFGNTSITRQDDDTLKVESPLNVVNVSLRSLSTRNRKAGSLPSSSAMSPTGEQAFLRPVKACWR